MSEKAPRRVLWSKKLVRRLLLSYALVPFIPPVLLLGRAVWHMNPGDSLGILILYWIFGLGAMAVFGTPLLFVYLRLGWTGFLPFLAGGGGCAAITAALLSGPHGKGMIETFGALGAVSGIFFRVLLFGIRKNSRLTERA